MKGIERKAGVVLLLSLSAANAFAVETTITGFAQVTVGRVIGGAPTEGQTAPTPYPLWSSTQLQNYQCPCFTANYEHAGVYEYGKTQVAPETLAGVQADSKFTPEFSTTVQAVARAADGTADLDWAYGTYQLTPDLSVQFGRKRLPLYYYSDFMYIGYAYPWIRPSADLYGWQIYSYDGANLLYKTETNGWALTGNAWVGTRHDNNNEMLGKLYYGERIDEAWKNMAGAYVDASKDIFDLRAVYMHATVERYTYVDGVKTTVMTGQNGDPVNDVGQDFYGLSVNMDGSDGWLLRTELNYIDRPSVKNTYLAQSYSAGRQFGNHTVMLGWSQFLEKADYWSSSTEKHTTETLSYRWDFAKSQALKLQYDSIKDQSGFFFTGNARLLSASWNYVF